MNVVHVGFPKTGSTFLQWHLFPGLRNWNFVDYHQCHQVFMDTIYLDDLDYDPPLVKAKLDAFVSGENNIASYEALTGAPFTFKGLNRSNVPVRLKQLGFHKVIITIRNQAEIIDSLYRQYVVQGGVHRFKDFLNLDQKWNPYLQSFELGYLRYDRLIRRYAETFGVENCLILPQELLKSDEQLFVDALQTFLGDRFEKNSGAKEANKSLSNFSIALLRILNHFTYNSQRPNQLISNHISSKNLWKLLAVVFDPYFFRFFSGRKSFLSRRDKKRLQDYYRESNRNLRDWVDWDIKELGYE